MIQSLLPGLSFEAAEAIHAVLRKMFHVFEFAVLAFAVTDEIHQLFISNRGPAALDVGVDTLGAVAAVLLVRAGLRRRTGRQAEAAG